MSELTRTAARFAQHVEDSAGIDAGVVRRLARRCAELEALVTEAEPGCPVCGLPVQQSGRGRPRVYCKRRCRDRAYRASKVRRNATMRPQRDEG